ncbi:hypothetical protein HanIR_Chr06g0276041 [Helianthus annuus]|nr:hypothetical protein HanIR_Chr06g0276041 [Helianthus annuus]
MRNLQNQQLLYFKPSINAPVVFKSATHNLEPLINTPAVSKNQQQIFQPFLNHMISVEPRSRFLTLIPIVSPVKDLSMISTQNLYLCGTQIQDDSRQINHKRIISKIIILHTPIRCLIQDETMVSAGTRTLQKLINPKQAKGFHIYTHILGPKAHH